MVATIPFTASQDLANYPPLNLNIEPVGALPTATAAQTGRLVWYQNTVWECTGSAWKKPDAGTADSATTATTATTATDAAHATNADHATAADTATTATTAGSATTATTATTALDSNKLGGQTLAQVRDFSLTTGQRTDAAISNFATAAATAALADRLDQFAAPTSALNINSQRLTAVGTPTTGTDGANKTYVDTAVANATAGLDVKNDVAVLATTNVTKSGLTTIDGYTLVAGDRVLQAVAGGHVSNGVWIAAAGSWTRATPQEELPGAFWFVKNGTANGATQWIVTNATNPVIGTDPVVIRQFGAQVTYTGTNGVQVVGSTISAVATGGGGISTTGGLAVDNTVSRSATVAIPAPGSGTAVTITSPYAPPAGRRLQVQVWRNSDNALVYCSVVNAPGSASVTLDFGTAPTAGQYSAEIRS
jgi:hypothetical protein